MDFAGSWVDNRNLAAAFRILVWIGWVVHHGNSESDDLIRVRAGDAAGTHAGSVKSCVTPKCKGWYDKTKNERDKSNKQHGGLRGLTEWSLDNKENKVQYILFGVAGVEICESIKLESRTRAKDSSLKRFQGMNFMKLRKGDGELDGVDRGEEVGFYT